VEGFTDAGIRVEDVGLIEGNFEGKQVGVKDGELGPNDGAIVGNFVDGLGLDVGARVAIDGTTVVGYFVDGNTLGEYEGEFGLSEGAFDG